MKKLMILLLGCVPFMTSAMAQETIAQRAAKKEMAKYNQTGEFEKCIYRNQIRKTVIIDDSNILFQMRGKKYMLNTIPKGCNGLEFERQFAMPVRNNRLCEKDFITTFRGATCMLSQFEVLDKKS